MTRKAIPAHEVKVGFLRRWIVLFGNLLVFFWFGVAFCIWLRFVSPLYEPFFDQALPLAVAVILELWLAALIAAMLVTAGLFFYFTGPRFVRLRDGVRGYIMRDQANNIWMAGAELPAGLKRSLIKWAKSDNSEHPYFVCRGACHSAHLYGLQSTFIPWSASDPFDARTPQRGASTAPARQGETRAKSGDKSTEKEKKRAKDSASRTEGEAARSEDAAAKDYEWHDDHLLGVLNDIIAEKIADGLRVRMASRGGFKEHYRTDSRSQKSYLYDGGDLPLRFSQWHPGGRFDSERAEGDGAPSLKPRYLIILCLANPIKDPVYVLPLASVLRRITETYGAELQGRGDASVAARPVDEILRSETVPLFLQGIPISPSNKNVFKILSLGRPVLKAQEGRFYSGFDIHRVDFDKTSTWERSALAKFNKSIDRCIDREVDDGEIEISMDAGDILIVDNYAAFHRRREIPPRAWPIVTTLPKRRCLLVYCGYPYEPGRGEAHAGRGEKEATPPRYLRNGVVTDIYAEDDEAD